MPADERRGAGRAPGRSVPNAPRSEPVLRGEPGSVSVETRGAARTGGKSGALHDEPRRPQEGRGEVDRLKDAFVSSITHELRTPLTSIRSLSEILLELPDDAPPETRRRFLEIIHQESERLTGLINDILDISRIEAGRIAWNDTPFDVGETIRRAAGAHRFRAGEKGIALVVEVATGLPRALADHARIEQVIANLVGNALKFSRDKTVVSIRAAALAGRRARDRGDWIVVSVIDRGIGIRGEDSEVIFDRFHQLHENVLRDKPRGAGLGLPICREIVEHYGGNLWVESSEGIGSAFHFTLPAAPDESDGP